MPLFRLTPTNPAAFAFRCNLWKEAAIVRAPDEETARRAASTAFYMAIMLPSGERTFRSSPWESLSHTAVELISDSRWESSGPAEVLEPSASEISRLHEEAVQHRRQLLCEFAGLLGRITAQRHIEEARQAAVLVASQDSTSNHAVSGPERVAIVGSRSYRRADLVEAAVAALPPDAVVISGGAPGVDTIAERAARVRGLEVTILAANWKLHGRKAGPLRNADIVTRANRVVAFWNGKSRGTLNTVVQAVRAGLPTEVVDAEGRPVPIDDVIRIAAERGIAASIDAAGR